MSKKRRVYSPPKVDFKAPARPSKTIPDQSLSIQEIVKRYVRGVPVDVVQRDGTYLDQDEHDMEKMTRADFGEKFDMAANFEADALRMKSDIEQRQRLDQEAAAKAKSDRIAARKAEKAASKSGGQ